MNSEPRNKNILLYTEAAVVKAQELAMSLEFMHIQSTSP
jgi:hypothetical protein